MTKQSSEDARTPERTSRVPQRLVRILIVATAVYFIGFILTFTGGTFARLFIPFQWESFFLARSMAENFQGRGFFYGSSIFGLFRNWLMLLALIGGGYFAFGWVSQKSK